MEKLTTDITQVEGFDKYLWFQVNTVLMDLTRGKWSCFFENKVLKDECLFEEFAYYLGNQFKYMKINESYINGTDYMYQMGGWTNGEISQQTGFAQYNNPGAFGGSKMATGMIIEPIKMFLSRFRLDSRRMCGGGSCFSQSSNPCNACCSTISIGGFKIDTGTGLQIA